MAADKPVEELLRHCACVELDERVAGVIREACLRQPDWDATIREAELHGMAPYLYRQITKTGAESPEPCRRKLAALGFRHTEALGIRTRALLEIAEQLTGCGIDVLVLKGAALAHLVYDPPGLRPMSDIDLLVPPGRLEDASRILAGLGYRPADDHAIPADHHHLPTVARTIDGLRVSIELHHDALAPDNIGSIRFGAFTEPARAFNVDGTELHTLGHVDMLRHLCRHTLEPRETTKIGSALDIMLYASAYAEDIDWPRLNRDFPEVINMLQLLAYLVPYPRRLRPYVPEPEPAAPQGVGVGLIPLSRLRRRSDWLLKLFDPSDWWLHGFYNVPPGRSLAYTKSVRHPGRVALWLWRRAGNAMR